MAEKLGISPDDLKRKIKDTWRRLEEIYSDSGKKGTLNIYKIKTYPTRSIFLTENTLVETPYQIASGRTNIPVFVFNRVSRQDSPYSFAQKDIEAIKKESTIEKSFTV